MKQLQAQIRTFCDERDWTQYHSPKELAIGISTEANELLEIFRFIKEDQLDDVLKQKKEAIANELSDVFFYLLRFADLYDIDLVRAFNNKMMINSQHYPVAKAFGSNKKYNEL
ncbi:hypothetical protein SDC9_211318 [bioreactor metagenome]|uniref:NTP pyrophosphohydrolase MazG putative catalytic core domain-containing protein n=1 Tax=bioreactor metagenome TaxID=1076179 RepID=A0A645JUU1_9ZZZZ